MASQALQGLEIAVLESRMSDELAGLIARHGGRTRGVPAVREVTLPADTQVAAVTEAFLSGGLAAVIALTGVGVQRFVDAAEQAGCGEQLLATLRAVPVVARGPKPGSVLKKLAVPSLPVPEPHTLACLCQTLEALPIKGRQVAVIHYGERDLELLEHLASRGASPLDVCVYEWRMPEDLEPLRALVRDAAAGEVPALLVTSRVQVRHLFGVAEAMGRAGELVAGLRRHTVIAAVGPSSAAELAAYGVPAQVEPEHPKMGPAVAALAAYIDLPHPPAPSPTSGRGSLVVRSPSPRAERGLGGEVCRSPAPLLGC